MVQSQLTKIIRKRRLQWSVHMQWMNNTRLPLRLYRGWRHPVFFFNFFILRNYCNSTLLWPTWIKLNLMTYELNVDIFYAQLGVFFYFCYFTEGWNLDQIESHDQGFSCWQILRPIGRFFSIFVISFDRDKTWIKLKLMTYEFNVDRFYAQLGTFSFFVISYDRSRGIKLGSNWNSWPMNYMLTDFTPNWALFLFSLFHMIDVWNMDEIKSYDLWI